MLTSVSAKERQAVLPKIEISFLSTSARANEGQQSHHKSKTRSHAPLRARTSAQRISHGSRATRLGLGFATLSKPRPPSPRALPSTPVDTFRQQCSALSTTASNMNRQASYNAALGSLVDAPNATAADRARPRRGGGGSGRNRRAPAPGFGLLRRQNQARAGCAPGGSPARTTMRRNGARHAQEGRQGLNRWKEDGAGDGCARYTVAAPVCSRPGVRRRHPLHGGRGWQGR